MRYSLRNMPKPWVYRYQCPRFPLSELIPPIESESFYHQQSHYEIGGGKGRVAVEKLASEKSAKIKTRQETPQTIFSSLLDICYHPVFDFFRGNRLFQQPPLFL